MHREKEKYLLFSSIIFAKTFLHLRSSHTSFFRFAKQSLESPIPTGSPNILAAVLLPCIVRQFLHSIHSCTTMMFVGDTCKTLVPTYKVCDVISHSYDSMCV
jgi:hypothetical protein